MLSTKPLCSATDYNSKLAICPHPRSMFVWPRFVASPTKRLIVVCSALNLLPAFGEGRVQKNLGSDSEITLLSIPVGSSVRGKRDFAMLALLLGCGLRRSELVHLTIEHLQRREDHWAIIDLVGKGGHVRTVPIPAWVKEAIDIWSTTANIKAGKLFRCVNKTGSIWGQGITEKVVWCMVRDCASKAKIERLAPHDLRRTCARLCHESGGELEQIQFLLGHVSVQTTERYLGCKQRLREAVNDKIGLETFRSSTDD